jgi:hypothetical protein
MLEDPEEMMTAKDSAVSQQQIEHAVSQQQI